MVDTKTEHHRVKRTFGIILLIIGGLGAFFMLMSIVFNATGKHIDGIFVADSCTNNLGGRSMAVYDCTGTFTPNDTNLKPVHYDGSDSYWVNSSNDLQKDVSYNSHFAVNDMNTQPATGDLMYIDGDWYAEAGSIFMSVGLIVIALILFWTGWGMLDLPRPFARKNKTAPTTAVQSSEQAITPDVIVTRSSSSIFAVLYPIFMILLGLGFGVFIAVVGVQDLAIGHVFAFVEFGFGIIVCPMFVYVGIISSRTPFRTKFETTSGKVTTYGLTGKHQLLLSEVVNQKLTASGIHYRMAFGTSALRLRDAKGNTVYIAFDDYEKISQEQVRVYLDQKWPEIGRVSL